MANTFPMTLQDLLDDIYVAVDNDPTNSTNADDEQTSRIRLVNMAIKAWEREDVLWNELWSTYTHGSTLGTATTYVISAADFRFAGSFCKFSLSGSDTYIEIVHPEEAFKFVNAGQRAVYITGNGKDGYTLNLTWTPAVGDDLYGSTISLNYYKSATKLVETTDTPEMSDPSYIVNFVSYRKNLYNGRGNVAQDYLTQTQACMDAMKVRNTMRVPYGSNAIEDIDQVRDNAVLGF